MATDIEPGQVRPYGSWPSPITTDLVVAAAVGLGEVWVADDDAIWWSELRPSEGGRVQLVRRLPDGSTVDVLPEGYSARTRVHEYGGGAWWVHGPTVYFTNWDDQRLYQLEVGGAPTPLTRPPLVPHGLRYADGRATPDGRWIVCVRESHEAGGEAVNELVAVPVAGGDALALGTSADFVSNPRISPDGRTLCWLQWDHPRMPWDGTELWTADLVADEHDLDLAAPRRATGGPTEAILQPEWDEAGRLHFLSDRTGWWNLYRFADAGRPASDDEGQARHELAADVGTPPWVFGMSRYALLPSGDTVLACSSAGLDHLRWLPAGSDESVGVETGFTSLSCLKSQGGGVVGIGASFLTEPVVFSLPDPGRSAGPDGPADGDADGDGDAHAHLPVIIRPARDLGLDEGWLSEGRPITFPTTDGVQAHALYYPPSNPACEAPDGERPPLVVAIHGGPTSAARPQLQLGIQYWTSRGFGVADVNYRGSTGFGRSYRELLDGQWGIADVEDCQAAAEWLATHGEVDRKRQAIHGGSAGGFTTLCALLGDSPFDAGTSSYGVTDLEALATDTHKFESRYLDGLVGPYPERRDLYVERSPIHRVDDLHRPVLILQGLEDEIVPPSQAEVLVEALRRNGVPFAYLAFEGEQHGFRQADTIRRALEAELFFYARVFGFEPPDVETELEIEGLEEGER